MADDLIAGAIHEQRTQREGAKDDSRLDWWREARFGMFIHWGLYSVPAGIWKGQDCDTIGEWIMHRFQIPVAEYEQLAKQFNPVKFDAAEWVSLAKGAGQKYMTITAKHHDGFCLFKSDYTDYNIVDGTPFGRDVIAELSEECQKQGLRLCFYYSQTQDWHHPDADGNTWDFEPDADRFAGYLDSYVKPQVRELLTKYGPIGLIWFDTPKGITAGQSESLLGLVHELQPDCLVSGRVGNAFGDYASAGDNKIPDTAVGIDWETPATINDTWGFKQQDHNWKSVEDLIRKLVDIASKNGNYLLNVGPTSEGAIPQPSVERLLAMGDWLGVNGDSVYGTKPGPLQREAWCRSTIKPGKGFLHVFDWPADGEIRVPSCEKLLGKAYLLSDSTQAALPVSGNGETVLIQGPREAPDPIDTVVVLEVSE